MTDEELIRKNRKAGMYVFLAVFLMVGVSFAAVPLYDLFCRVTGFGGTTGVSEALPGTVLEREMRIQFNASTSRDMPWNFTPDMRETTIQIGARGLTAYTAHNPTREIVSGTAIYNVTPLKAGKYFHKIQCFCFDEQALNPGQEVSMPVMFYVDPAIADDPNLDDVKTITLSYTFFKADTKALDDALEGFYNSDKTGI